MIDARADWRTRWTARIGAGVVWMLARTWRVRYVNRGELDEARRQRTPVVFVVWHGQLLPALWTHRGHDVSVLISEHRDGEIIARVAHFLGFRTVRGSTTRGANRALIGLVRELEAGYDVALTPDGPKGPARNFAPGALLVAQRAERPVLPVGLHASRAWQMKSWDRFILPKPFARITVNYGPFMAAPTVNPKALADEAPRFQEALDAALAGADRAAAGRAGGA
jgi:lysophospholipid acyltransferase (LPLAT)-like uncharacterized protein